MRRSLRGLAAVAFTALLSGLSPAAHAADDGFTISHVQPAGGAVQILLSVPEDVDTPLDSLAVTIDGQVAQSTAESAGESVEKVRRTTILTIDTSNSMARKGRFAAAKEAALAFLDSAPDDVYVGIVTFDSDVETALEPTLDRDSARSVVDGLGLALQTRLNDAVITAAELAGDEGQRNLLVLSDGRDTSKTPESEATTAITDSGVIVDVVALDQSGPQLRPLKALAEAGNGAVVKADPKSLTAAFDDEAQSLSRQVLLTATIPDGVTGTEASVTVTSGDLTDSAHVVIRDASAPPPVASGSDDSSGTTVSHTAMLVGVGALGVGLLGFLGALFWTTGTARPALTAEQRIAAYTGDAPAPEGGPSMPPSPQLTMDQARAAAATVLHHNRGLEQRIGSRLVAAGSKLKPAEWLLIHAGTTLGAGLVGALLGAGDILFILLFLVVGFLVPWLWLGRKRRKRVNAFNEGLADTLQLIAGSLSAGMSLAQAIDTVVQEGRDPIAGEFRQALVQSRLGRPLVDALDDIAVRTESTDFAWVVMAIRIQRQVGGNLAELLTTVAATIRERAFLRRQVQTLSAEGRLSGWILGLLPVLIGVYLLLVRREYIRPLYTEALGLVMLFGAVVLLGLGAFVISRIVKVEV